MALELTLTVVGGPATGKALTAAYSPIVVGRSPHADLCVADPKLSLSHCQIVVEGYEVAVQGLAGGVSVDGRRGTRLPLADGSRITIGATEIEVRFIGSTSATTAPVASPTPIDVPAPVSVAPPPPPKPVGPSPLDHEKIYHLGDPPDTPRGPRPVLVDPAPDRRCHLHFAAAPDFTPAHPAGLLYAVLDGTRAIDLAFQAKAAGYDPVSLFFGDAALSLAMVAPYAFPVPTGSDFLVKWTALLGQNAGILLDAPTGGPELLLHLRHAFIAKDETGQEYFFRFYDPRVLRKYLPTCTAAELGEFFGPVRGIVTEGEAADGYVYYGVGPGGLVVKNLGAMLIDPAT